MGLHVFQSHLLTQISFYIVYIRSPCILPNLSHTQSPLHENPCVLPTVPQTQISYCILHPQTLCVLPSLLHTQSLLHENPCVLPTALQTGNTSYTVHSKIQFHALSYALSMSPDKYIS